MKNTLKKTFGFDDFRENQEEIITATLERRDVFAVMPTGGGKSLCYQLPALLLEGLCVVVSPLIALMKDQVDGAQANGISAAYINSTLEVSEKQEIMQRLNAGEIDLLYVAPERLSLPTFWEYLATLNIAAFAIDEAHCISEWGHDFRPDYQVLTRLKREFPDVPVSAFTASATDVVQQDILKRLNLSQPLFIKASFDRPNLFYQIEHKHKVNEQIADFILRHPGEAGIVYRTTRKDVETTAAFLTKNGMNALPYHAGLDNDERKENQDRFSRDDALIIVATVAFGMGIDKSNIRFIVHGDLPKSLEGYYQETGRAGRDGEHAHCLLLYSIRDQDTQHYFIGQVEDPEEQQRQLAKLDGMLTFARGETCRRSALLQYFGEQYGPDNCGTCDSCTGKHELVDITRDAQILMSGILRTNERFGIAHVIDVIRGANTKQIRSFKHDQLKTYGAGEHLSKEEWTTIFERLLADESINRLVAENNRVVVTPKGKDLLFGKRTISMRRGEAKQLVTAAIAPYNSDLFMELKSLRKTIASDRAVPPFVIFSDKCLYDMARYYPIDTATFLRIQGVGQRKLDDFGQQFMTIIRNYLEAHPETDCKQYGDVSDQSSRRSRYKKATRPSLYADSVRLVNQGLSIEQVAQQLDRSPGTIAGHLEKAKDDGVEIKQDHLITTPHQAAAETAFKSIGTDSLGAVYHDLNETVSYDQLRLIRMMLNS